jgi:hypothetical protein
MLLSPDEGTVYSHPACVGFRVGVRVRHMGLRVRVRAKTHGIWG